MCNINLIKRKDEYSSQDINYYMDIVSWNSFSNNSHGEGFIGFDSRKMILDRSVEKILYKDLPKFHTLITHQRFATSGFTESNIHPHESKNFILQHNGVFSGLGDKDKSDTKIYLEKLDSLYEEHKDIVKCIKMITNDVKGSFSIVLIDKNTGKIYYYKNSSTNMFIIQDKNYLIMSTIQSNLKIAKLFFKMKASIKEVKDDLLFEITRKGLVFIARIKNKEKKDKNSPVTLNDFSMNNYKNYKDDYWLDKMMGELKESDEFYFDERGKRIRI